MSATVVERFPGGNKTLLVPGWAGWNWAVEDTTAAVAAAPDQVGPRLKQLRARRGVTVTALSEATGISERTLTRLGRPTCT